MADLTMCLSKDCKQFKNCYRAQATPNLIQQSYSNFDCENFEYFVPCQTKKEFNKLEKK